MDFFCPYCKHKSTSLLALRKHKLAAHKKTKTTKTKRQLHPVFWKQVKKKRMDGFQKHLIENKTAPERLFMELLDRLKIRYEFQFPVKNKFFDFYLPDYNIIVEIDGDYYHCNPKIYDKPKYKVQKRVVKNDLRKNLLCEKEGYTLLRYWESDLNKEMEKVIEDLLKNIKK